MNLVPDTSPHSTLRQHFRDLGYSWSWTKLCRNMVSWVQWPYRRILKIFRFVTVAVIQWSFYPRYFLPYVLVFCGSSILDCWTRPSRELLGTEREKSQKKYTESNSRSSKMLSDQHYWEIRKISSGLNWYHVQRFHSFGQSWGSEIVSSFLICIP